MQAQQGDGSKENGLSMFGGIGCLPLSPSKCLSSQPSSLWPVYSGVAGSSALWIKDLAKSLTGFDCMSVSLYYIQSVALSAWY